MEDLWARGSKKKYTSKQRRKAHDIEKGYKKRGVSSKEAERRAWATVNKSDRGAGKKAEVAAGKSAANRVRAKVGEMAVGSKALPDMRRKHRLSTDALLNQLLS